MNVTIAVLSFPPFFVSLTQKSVGFVFSSWATSREKIKFLKHKLELFCF